MHGASISTEITCMAIIMSDCYEMSPRGNMTGCYYFDMQGDNT
jgi:hypothetical protein